jgi:hypothetical protein
VRHGQERNRGEHDHHATNESSSEEEDEAGLILLPEFSAFRFLDLNVGVRFRLPVLCDRHLVIAGRILLVLLLTDGCNTTSQYFVTGKRFSHDGTDR